jgi:hypothetical protein
LLEEVVRVWDFFAASSANTFALFHKSSIFLCFCFVIDFLLFFCFYVLW